MCRFRSSEKQPNWDKTIRALLGENAREDKEKGRNGAVVERKGLQTTV